MNKNSILILIFIICLCVYGCDFDTSSKSVDNKKSELENKNSNDTKSDKSQYIYNLSDEEIIEAIKKGKELDATESMEMNYSLPLKENTYIIMPEAEIMTPYWFIVRSSILAWDYCEKDNDSFDEGMEYHLKSAKDTLHNLGSDNCVYINIKLYSDEPDFHKSTNIILQQNDKTIKSVKFMKLNDELDNMEKDSDKPYIWAVTAIISLNDKDLELNKSSTLVISYKNSQKSIFEVDFKKYK